MHCFFDDSQYHNEFINKTELRSKSAGYNRTTIEVSFNLEAISTKGLKNKLKKTYGETVAISKSFT